MNRTSIIIFGASGDLTQRKLIPSLFHLFIKRKTPRELHVFGFGSFSMRGVLQSSSQGHVKTILYREESTAKTLLPQRDKGARSFFQTIVCRNSRFSMEPFRNPSCISCPLWFKTFLQQSHRRITACDQQKQGNFFIVSVAKRCLAERVSQLIWNLQGIRHAVIFHKAMRNAVK